MESGNSAWFCDVETCGTDIYQRLDSASDVCRRVQSFSERKWWRCWSRWHQHEARSLYGSRLAAVCLIAALCLLLNSYYNRESYVLKYSLKVLSVGSRHIHWNKEVMFYFCLSLCLISATVLWSLGTNNQMNTNRYLEECIKPVYFTL